MTGLELEGRIGLSDEQAEAIVQMKLGQLAGLERQKVTDELYGFLKKITELDAILADVKLVYDIITKDLSEIRR